MFKVVLALADDAHIRRPKIDRSAGLELLQLASELATSFRDRRAPRVRNGAKTA